MAEALDPHPSPLIVTAYAFAQNELDRLRAVVGADRVVAVTGGDALIAALRAHPTAEVLCAFGPPADLAALAPAIRWVQLASAGADFAIRAGLVTPDTPLLVTTASGIHAVPIAEYVFSSLLVFVRGWRRLLELQAERDWPSHPGWAELRTGELAGGTLGIIGLGHIGRRVAQLGRAFGMRVLGLRRSASTDPDLDADVIYPPTALTNLLAASDFVVITVPRTPATHHLIGEPELRAMRPHAYLANVARGDVIDEAALVRALREGWIAGAGLDVTDHEPLDPASPLWTMPNVYLSPHTSGNTTRYGERLMDLFLDNLDRYRTGRPLLNVVDPLRGY